MHRTTICLTAGQLRGIKEVGQLDHLSMSSTIRILLTEGIARRKRAQAAQVAIPRRARRSSRSVLSE